MRAGPRRGGERKASGYSDISIGDAFYRDRIEFALTDKLGGPSVALPSDVRILRQLK